MTRERLTSESEAQPSDLTSDACSLHHVHIPDAHESVVERRIREAMERGEFDDLPGTGRPLPGAGEPYDEMWWVKAWLRRNDIGAAELRRPQPDDTGDPRG